MEVICDLKFLPMMKKIFYLVLPALLFISGCGKKPENHPTISISYTASGLVVDFVSTNNATPSLVDWDFGDGKTGSGSTITHTYGTTGTYTVKATASYSNGKSATATKVVSLGTAEKIVQMSTKYGDMFIWLYDETPLHKANFLKLVTDKYLDGTTFHRVEKDFVIQGGDPNSKDNDSTNDGYGGPSYTIPFESNTNGHVYGALGAASKAAAGPSSGSQFYFVTNKSGTPNLNGNYVVFGIIMKGLNVADAINVLPVYSLNGGVTHQPYEKVPITCTVLTKTRAEILTEYGYTVK